MERRDFIRQGALAAGVAWAAPMVHTSHAFASEGTPSGACDSSSYDVLAQFEGTVSGEVGPKREFPKDGNDCFANLAVTAPGKSDPFLTSDTFCVGGSHTEDDCSAFCRLEQAHLDLTNVDPALDVTLSADVIESEASADCDSDDASASTTLTSATLCIAGDCQTLNSSPSPNTKISATASIDSLTDLEVTVILNEQQETADGIMVNAVHVIARTIVGTDVVQKADVVLCHAEASCAT